MENNFVALAYGFTCDGVFKFGKHKGKSFVEVATELKEPDYFLWLYKKSNPSKIKEHEPVFGENGVNWFHEQNYQIIEKELIVKAINEWDKDIYRIVAFKKPSFRLDNDLRYFIDSNLERLKICPIKHHIPEGDWGDYGDSF